MLRFLLQSIHDILQQHEKDLQENHSSLLQCLEKVLLRKINIREILQFLEIILLDYSLQSHAISSKQMSNHLQNRTQDTLLVVNPHCLTHPLLMCIPKVVTPQAITKVPHKTRTIIGAAASPVNAAALGMATTPVMRTSTD